LIAMRSTNLTISKDAEPAGASQRFIAIRAVSNWRGSGEENDGRTVRERPRIRYDVRPGWRAIPFSEKKSAGGLLRPNSRNQSRPYPKAGPDGKSMGRAVIG